MTKKTTSKKSKKVPRPKPIEIKILRPDFPPFNPSKDPEKGCHRNAYIKTTQDVATMVFNSISGDPPVRSDFSIRLNKGDSIRISSEDYEQRFIYGTYNKKGLSIPYPIRFAIKRGWMWIKGELPSNQILTE